jgi:hypothetical protein
MIIKIQFRIPPIEIPITADQLAEDEVKKIVENKLLELDLLYSHFTNYITYKVASE